ncbi:hypothetical protein AVL50_02885 [Flammeovirga sp. SJP92]|nr:hypothetical protein AVL50_02895 [Flammeovirga sp. SJP92]KXX72083.1 hypothetical protein AVL50_02885 [Flammeovirga sp. SJP92]
MHKKLFVNDFSFIFLGNSSLGVYLTITEDVLISSLQKYTLKHFFYIFEQSSPLILLKDLTT